MRLALLCDDRAALPWLDAIAHDSVHEVTLAVTLTPAATELLRGRSGIKLTPHWEDLVGARSFDAILVGGSDPQVLEAIKQLASAGQKLLFLPNIAQGSTYIYELSLIRDDNRVPIHPALWHRCDPLLMRTRDAIRAGSMGGVHLIQLQRELVADGGMAQLSQAAVDAAMLTDFDLLRWLSGDYDQVTALRTGVSEKGLLTQSVKLAGRGLPESTWGGSAGKSPSCRLTIQAERDAIVLEFGQATNEWVSIDPDGTRNSSDRQAAIHDYLSALDSDRVPMEWPELVKDFETVDATHRSVARRRTIELHFEPMSERAMFKTQMTAIGCSVLMATLVLVLVYLAVASTIPLPPNRPDWCSVLLVVLRTLIFAPLGVFLLLQILYPLTRPSESDR